MAESAAVSNEASARILVERMVVLPGNVSAFPLTRTMRPGRVGLSTSGDAVAASDGVVARVRVSPTSCAPLATRGDVWGRRPWAGSLEGVDRRPSKSFQLPTD